MAYVHQMVHQLQVVRTRQGWFVADRDPRDRDDLTIRLISEPFDTRQAARAYLSHLKDPIEREYFEYLQSVADCR